MKKKLLSLALALVMCLGLMVPVSAEVRYSDVIDGVSITMDSNGTLDFSGTGVLSTDTLFEAGDEYFFNMSSEYPEIKEITINIGSGVTLKDKGLTLEEKDFYDLMCDNIRGNAYGYGITTVNINYHGTAPTPAPAPTPTPAAPSAAPSKFSDVAANSPYKDAINWAVEKNITKGTSATTFSPNQTCSVAHILAFIFRSESPDELASMAEAYGSEMAAVRSEVLPVINDYLKSTANMQPLTADQPCTRALAVQLLYLMLGDGSAAPASGFSDVPSDSGVLAEAVGWAVEKGITTGTSATTFSPNNICTRGQIVTFLYRADKAK